MKYLVVYHDTIGLKHDAEVLSQAIHAAQPDAQVFERVVKIGIGFDSGRSFRPGKVAIENGPFDATFLLEHTYIDPVDFRKSDFGKCVFIPNIEWVNSKDQVALESGSVDAVLYKTRHAKAIGGDDKAFRSVAEHKFVGWTSRDASLPGVAMDFRQALHVRGISVQKQTNVVLDTWIDHGAEMPPLEVFARVTDDFVLREPVTQGENATIHLREVPWSEIRYSMNSRGLHICPSLTEGFGHYLNEARAVGALVITTDGPPMNELIADGETGILVSASRMPPEPGMFVDGFRIAKPDLRAAVCRALALSPSQLTEITSQARAGYRDDKVNYHNMLSEFLDSIHENKAGQGTPKAGGRASQGLFDRFRRR